MNVPKLRFKEFNNLWQNEKLEDAVEFLDEKRKPIKDSDRNNIKGEYPYYGASGIIDYINDYIFDEDLLLLGEDGANILSRSTKLVFKATGKYWVNNHAHVLKPKENYNIDFLESYLENINYESYNTGTAQPKLNQEVCKKINIKIPSLKEQEKIGKTLSLLDKKIELQTKKIEDLKLFKKGLLDIIFNNNFINSKKLNELNIIVSDGNYGELYPKSNELTDIGEVPFIRVNNLVDLHLTFNNMKYITKEKHDSLLSGHLQENDILITTRGDIGKVAIVDKKFIDANINAQIALLRLNNKSEVIPYYLLEYLNYNYNYIQTFITGSALKQLPIKNLMKLQINFPSIEIQRKYSKLLIIYNKKIDIENQILDKLNELKKGLMQSMFV